MRQDDVTCMRAYTPHLTNGTEALPMDQGSGTHAPGQPGRHEAADRRPRRLPPSCQMMGRVVMPHP